MKIEEYNSKHNLDEILYIDKENVEDFIDDIYSQDDLYDINKSYKDENSLMVVW